MTTATFASPETTAHAMERLNRKAWSDREALRWYASASGFIDPGERLAFSQVLPDAMGQSVLDLGVGGGRTTAQLLPVAGSYVGLDYTPAMVTICRRKFPGVPFYVADARDLSAFDSESFQLVVFSYNGLDAVDLAGRRKVLAEVNRVLKPGGAFFFSTFNRAGPDFTGHFRFNRGVHWNGSVLGLVTQAGRFAVSSAVGFVRRLQNLKFERDEGGHGILLHSAHDFGVLVYATTAAEVRSQLAFAGFDEPRIISSSDGAVREGELKSSDVYVHVIARKPATGH
jgi:ubiquinone/menaquinone biosynthesis C-methylase UbiE